MSLTVEHVDEFYNRGNPYGYCNNLAKRPFIGDERVPEVDAEEPELIVEANRPQSRESNHPHAGQHRMA